MELSGRDDILARYRHFRQLSIAHHKAAVRCVSASAMLAQGKRLGLASGKTFMLNDDDDMSFVFDLVLYTAPPGRTRGIDRYARSFSGEADGDEGHLLEAMRSGRFSVWRIERRHETAGLVMRDLIHEGEWWLVDEGMEASAPIGTCLALRLCRTPDGFAMTSGTSAVVYKETVEDAFDAIERILDKLGTDATEDRRFAEAFYKFALLDKEAGDVLWRAA